LTAVFVALMALGLAAAVGYPLWKGVREEALPAFAAGLVVQNGVTYADPDELALDRALGRLRGGAEAAVVASVDLEEELERQVAALRQGRRTAAVTATAPAAPPGTTTAGECPQCGHPFDAGDSFCVRCGASLAQICSNCGNPFDAGDLFCSKCGHRLQVEF
jgi:hypothetical protein